jgi:hypothetical protein
MDTQRVTALTTTTANRVAAFLTVGDLKTDMDRARWLAHWLDAKFSVGGMRFGLQGVIGLLPIGGDAVATMLGLYPLVVAYRHKLGGEVMARLVGNLVLEFVIGLLPWVGDYADVWFKANLRNLAVLERAVASRADAE